MAKNEVVGFSIGLVAICLIGWALYIHPGESTPEQAAAREAKKCPEVVKVKEILAKRDSYFAVKFSDDHVEILNGGRVSVGTLFCKKENEYEIK